MFTFSHDRAMVNSGKSRAEFQGNSPEPKYKYDLQLIVKHFPVQKFDKIYPGILEHMYKKVPLDETDADLADQAEATDDYVLQLRFPEMSCTRAKGQQMQWEHKGIGYRLTIHIGLDDGKSDLILINVELKDVKTRFFQNGNLELQYRLIAEPNSAEAGILDQKIQQEIEFSLEPPSAEKQAQLELEARKREIADEGDDYEDEED